MVRAPHTSSFCRPGRTRAARAITAAVRWQRPGHRVWPWLMALLLLLALATGLQAQMAINATGTAPNPGGSHAILDISSADKGLLAPRMLYAHRVNLTGSAPDGLLVYQTDSAGAAPRGYYYWDAATPVAGWRHIAWGPKVWELGGNAGTNPGPLPVDFLGTINNQPLVFRTFAQDRGRITAAGALQLYITAPATTTELVQVEGGVKLNGGSAASNAGTIRFTPSPGGGVPGKFEGNVANAGYATISASSINGWKQLDNVLAERKAQESQLIGVGCAYPSNTALTKAAVTTGPRQWPMTGGVGPFGTTNGAQSPYYGLWEDSRRQYLIRVADLNAAGICPTYPIDAIAFNVTSVFSGSDSLHFIRFSLKNTALTTLAAFDNAMAGFTYAMPKPPEIPGPPPSYASGHGTGYNVTTGWNVHAYDQGGTAFSWAGGTNNILLDAAVDDQDWPQVKEGQVETYNTSYNSMISMYCDACGGDGTIGHCKWKDPAPGGFYFPPTTPTNAVPETPPAGTNSVGWGWTGGWTLTGGINTITCDGTFEYSGGGTPATANKLPRVAFLCRYIGGGTSYNVGSYMYAQDGVMIGDATWANGGAFRGPGTITAKRSVWSNTSLLSDYVFDLYYDGRSKPQDATGADQYVRTPLKDLPNYVERERHLPTVDGRDTWNREGGFSVDKLGKQLWVTVEDQALYIKELNERMDALQQFLVEKKLKELQGK